MSDWYLKLCVRDQCRVGYGMGLFYNVENSIPLRALVNGLSGGVGCCRGSQTEEDGVGVNF